MNNDTPIAKMTPDGTVKRPTRLSRFFKFAMQKKTANLDYRFFIKWLSKGSDVARADV